MWRLLAGPSEEKQAEAWNTLQMEQKQDVSTNLEAKTVCSGSSRSVMFHQWRDEKKSTRLMLNGPKEGPEKDVGRVSHVSPFTFLLNSTLLTLHTVLSFVIVLSAICFGIYWSKFEQFCRFTQGTEFKIHRGQQLNNLSFTWKNRMFSVCSSPDIHLGVE